MLITMPRPITPRRVGCPARAGGFRPIGGPASRESVVLGLDGLEAIRLADLEGLYQDAAAERMGVSRQTYARILVRARQAVAAALLGRRLLLVEPGPVIEEASPPLECPVHGGPRRHGRTCRCPAQHEKWGQAPFPRHVGPCGEHCGCRGRQPVVPAQPPEN